jgi:hypothetical protein
MYADIAHSLGKSLCEIAPGPTRDMDELLSTASLCVSKKCIDFSHHIARISVFQYLILGIARARKCFTRSSSSSQEFYDKFK